MLRIRLSGVLADACDPSVYMHFADHRLTRGDGELRVGAYVVLVGEGKAQETRDLTCRRDPLQEMLVGMQGSVRQVFQLQFVDVCLVGIDFP